MTEQELAVSTAVSLGCSTFFAWQSTRKVLKTWKERKPLRGLSRATDLAEEAKELWEAALSGTVSADQFINLIERRVKGDHEQRQHGAASVPAGHGLIASGIRGGLPGLEPAPGTVAATVAIESGVAQSWSAVARIAGKHFMSVLFLGGRAATRGSFACARWGITGIVRSLAGKSGRNSVKGG